MSIDWTSDEAVVRAAVPTAHTEYGVNIWESAGARHRYFCGTNQPLEARDAEGYLGSDWHHARNHPTVVSFEQANNPREATGGPSLTAESAKDATLEDMKICVLRDCENVEVCRPTPHALTWRLYSNNGLVSEGFSELDMFRKAYRKIKEAYSISSRLAPEEPSKPKRLMSAEDISVPIMAEEPALDPKRESLVDWQRSAKERAGISPDTSASIPAEEEAASGMWKVMLDTQGCKTCGHNAQWCVVNPEGTMLGMTYGDRDDAEWLCETINRAIEQAWNARPFTYLHKGKSHTISMEDAQRRFAELLDAQEWISVGERLPEFTKKVFVCDADGTYTAARARMAGDVGWVWAVKDLNDWAAPSAFTHWSEIPSPPTRTAEGGSL